MLYNGLHLPWAEDEFESALQFLPGSMHIMVHVGKEADRFLEKEFWDVDIKDEKGLGHDMADWDWIDAETWEDRKAEDTELAMTKEMCKDYYTGFKNYCVSRNGKDTP